MNRFRFPSTVFFSIVLALTCLATIVIAAVGESSSQSDEQPAKLGPARSDCTIDLARSRHPRERWREISDLTMRVAAASTGMRQRGARPPQQLVDPQIPIRNFVDEEIFGTMQRDGIRSTILAGDEEFLRRVTLDLTGEIPTSATVKSFLADTRTNKRDTLIDQLLASEAFTDRWTMWFGDLVQNVQFATNIAEYPQGRNAYYTFIRDSIKNAKPYDQMVRELLAGSGENFQSGPANYVVRQIQRNGPPQDTYDNLSAHSGEKFLALPLTCVSCHGGAKHLELVNSFMATKTRTEFWGNAAFFAKTGTRGFRDPANPNVVQFRVLENPLGAYRLDTTTGNKTARIAAQGQSQTVEPAFFLTGETPRSGEPLRDAYGRMLTGHPQFARATVNYLWREVFRLGLVEPIDSMDLLRLDPSQLPAGATLQTLHPALLTRLAESFETSAYSLRAILKTMVTSSAYQLSAAYTPGEWNETWTPYFARHYARRLSAEMLLDAVVAATAVRVSLPVNGLPPVTKAMALPDTLELGQRSPYGRFLNAFGRGDRDETPRSSEGSILQALSLLNDPIVVTRVRQSTPGSSVQTVLQQTSSPGTIAETLYLSTLSRYPTPEEKTAAVSILTSGSLAAKTEDLQFALLNRLEFLFN